MIDSTPVMPGEFVTMRDTEEMAKIVQKDTDDLKDGSDMIKVELVDGRILDKSPEDVEVAIVHNNID